MKLFMWVVILGLVGCSATQTTAPSPSGSTYHEPGFAAYCAAHPHVGICP